MSAILELPSAQSGQTLYATIHDNAAKLANGVSTEVYNGSNWSTYVNSLTEQGNTGYYVGTWPTYLTSGKYSICFYQQQGGSPALGDPNIGNSQSYFNGTIEEQGIGSVLTAYKLDKLILNTAGGSPPTIGSYFDQIFNADSGQTFSQAIASLQALQRSAGGGPTAIQIANQVWDVVLPGAHTVVNSGSMLLQAIVNMLPTVGPISNFNPSSQTVNLGASQIGVTIGTVNALGSTAQTQVAAAVQALLNATSIPELTGVPGATPTIYQALMLMYMSLRNQHTATSNQEKIYNNSGSAITAASLSDDGSIFTKSQFS